MRKNAHKIQYILYRYKYIQVYAFIFYKHSMLNKSAHLSTDRCKRFSRLPVTNAGDSVFLDCTEVVQLYDLYLAAMISWEYEKPKIYSEASLSGDFFAKFPVTSVDSLIHFLIRRRWCELRMRVTARSTAANDQVHPLTNRVCYGILFSFNFYLDIAKPSHCSVVYNVLSIRIRLTISNIGRLKYNTSYLCAS